MANIRLPAATRNALAQKIQELIDAGAGPGILRIYDGTQPASGGGAITTQVLLGTLTFSDPSAPAAAAGVLTFSVITQDTAADATSTATWARILDSNGVVVFDCDVNTSGATLNFNTVAFVTGGPIQISSFTITMPAN
jgi:hypothetical protein